MTKIVRLIGNGRAPTATECANCVFHAYGAGFTTLDGCVYRCSNYPCGPNGRGHVAQLGETLPDGWSDQALGVVGVDHD